jgi:DNA (cytosine-5)-methyltransferase 1
MVCYENNLQKAVGFTQCDAARDVGDNISPTLRSGGDGGYPAHSVATNMAVRRLTPIECERLQGFPDNYTNIRENCPDGPRYKAMGNSMAVPVMRWIGERINKVNNEQ